MPFGPEYSGSVGGAGGENLFTMYNTGKTGKPLRFSGSEGVLQ
jgi:hypothetical protein